MKITFTDEELLFMNCATKRDYCGKDVDCSRCFIKEFNFECFDVMQNFIELYKKNGYKKTFEVGGINNEDIYFIVYDWMVKDLRLSGNELNIYAIIDYLTYGKTYAKVELSYLCEHSGATKNTVLSCLKKLQDKKLIEKQKVKENGVDICFYKTNRPDFNQ